MTNFERANQIYATIYSSGTTINQSSYIILEDIQDVRFSTGYPGGQCLDGTFFVPRDLQEFWPLAGGQRVVLRNGSVMIYEGYISSFDRMVDQRNMGTLVNLTGAWGWIMMQRKWYKIWSDIRTGDSVWKWVPGIVSGDKSYYELERTNRLAIGCKQGVQYSTLIIGAVEYTAKAGETIKRITYDYEIRDSGATPDFQFAVYRSDPSPAEVASSVVTSGTGSLDYDFVTPCNSVQLRVTPLASFTTAAGDYWWADIRKLCVYTEINDPFYIYDLGQDVIGKVTSLNSTTKYCGSGTINTVVKLLGTPSASYDDTNYPAGFGAFNYESCADILAMGAAFGRGSTYDYGRVGYGVYPSSYTDESDGKPCLFMEDYPDVSTDYDYLIGLDDLNLQVPFSVTQDFQSVKNYVIVRYSDDQDAEQYYTPDDDATLKDQTSIDTYGQREAIVNAGYADSITALNVGIKHLKYYKDPKYILSGPIVVFNHIEDKYGQKIPVSQIKAGSILRLRNWFSATADYNNRLAFVITATMYDDATNTVSLTAGPPPELIYPSYVRPMVLEPLNMGRRQTPDEAENDRPRGDGSGYRGGLDNEMLRWRKDYGLMPWMRGDRGDDGTVIKPSD